MKRKTVNIVFKIRNACTKCCRLVVGKNKFLKDKKTYTAMLKDDKFHIKKENIFPRYLDYIQNSGDVDEHYFYQDIYMARKVLERNPDRHYDVGSRLDGFISHLLTVRDNITMIDVRPLPYTIEGLNFLQADATNMPGIPDESIESLSCLHALEHFGLGRYGDPIDPYAWKKTLNSFQRVLKKGGVLYLSVPVGDTERVCFNAHRVFAIKTILENLTEMTLIDFAYIKDRKIFTVDAEAISTLKLHSDYVCGLYTLIKN